MGIRLEGVTPGAQLAGVTGDNPVTVIAAAWIGSNPLRLTYRTADGRLDERILYRDHEPRLTLTRASAAYEFQAHATTFKLAAEALRIRMAGRFDPMLAVHTSDLDALPHQIQAVYGELLNRTPLRPRSAPRRSMTGHYLLAEELAEVGPEHGDARAGLVLVVPGASAGA
jgi:hypothetical protein